MINRTFKSGSIRVAGDYTCIHIPWHKNFQKKLDENEYESYLTGNNSTNWFAVEDQIPIEKRPEKVTKGQSYILAATADISLENSIYNFLDKYGKSYIDEELFFQSPPCCELTDIFTSDLTEDEFKKIFKDILHKINSKNTLKKFLLNYVKGIQKNENDFIRINSPFLKQFTKEFIQKQNLPASIIKGKNQIWKIVLRKKIFKLLKNPFRIQELQKIINRKFQKNWRISIYKINGTNKKLFCSCIIN